MRCDQPIGLTVKAIKFLAENRKQANFRTAELTVFDDGRVEVSQLSRKEIERVPYGQYEGMFDTKYNLYEYELKDSPYPPRIRKVREVLQTTIWSSGPMMFLCLEIEGIGPRLFEWTEEEMEQY